MSTGWERIANRIPLQKRETFISYEEAYNIVFAFHRWEDNSLPIINACCAAYMKRQNACVDGRKISRENYHRNSDFEKWCIQGEKIAEKTIDFLIWKNIPFAWAMHYQAGWTPKMTAEALISTAKEFMRDWLREC